MEKRKGRVLQGFLFLSGFTALVYQITWIKDFKEVFGVDVYSASTVLAAFMAGLALGSYLFGEYIDKGAHPLKVFLLIECLLALFAIFFPPLFKGLTAIYRFSIDHAAMDPLIVQLIKSGYSFLFLLVPTTLMGGSLPVISKYFIKELNKLGFNLSKLYSANNLGAVIGCFLSGFIFIKILGTRNTVLMASALNLLNALLAGILLAKDTSWYANTVPAKRTPNKNARNDRKPVPFLVKLALWVFAIEGFTTLAYEIIWTRILLEFSFDKSVYFYTIVILPFIFGLSLGSYLVKSKIDKIKNKLNILAYLEIAIGLVSIFLFIVFSKISPALIESRDSYNSWFSLVFQEYSLIFFLLLIPAILMGITFPLVGKIWSGHMPSLGKKIGQLGFMDTVGSILGALMAGFLLIPFLGIYKSFILTAIINITIGTSLILFQKKTANPSRLTSLSVAIALLILFIRIFPEKEYIKNKLKYYPEDTIVSYHEGVGATVSIHDQPDGYKALTINGSKTAYTNPNDLRVHKLLGYLPYFFHPGETKNALVIGFGLGVTTHSLSREDIPVVDVAEICPGVIKSSANYFSYHNQDAIQHENVKVFIEDGRSYLYRSPRTYDIITSNAVHARLSSNLYTKDFYELCKDRLSENGMVCQWLPTNWLSKDEFRALVKAFHQVFPNSSFWYVTRGHALLLGSQGKMVKDYQKLQEHVQKPNIRKSLAEAEIFNLDMLLGQLLMDPADLEKYCKGAPVNTDNKPIVEYSQVMDLKPNLNVLSDMASTRYDINKGINLIAVNGRSKECVARHIQNYNKLYREQLMHFINGFELEK